MSTPPFGPILAAAEARHGAEAIAARLATPKTAAELAPIPDDRYLSQMSLRIFRAGLKHELVDAKWPAFEEVWHGFDPARCAGVYDEELEAMLADRRLIRHLGKLRAIRHNAAAMLEIAGRAWLVRRLAGRVARERDRWLVGGAGQAVQPARRQLGARFPAHGRQGHLHPDPFGEPGARPLGCGTHSPVEPGGPPRRAQFSTPGRMRPVARCANSADPGAELRLSGAMANIFGYDKGRTCKTSLAYCAASSTGTVAVERKISDINHSCHSSH